MIGHTLLFRWVGATDYVSTCNNHYDESPADHNGRQAREAGAAPWTGKRFMQPIRFEPLFQRYIWGGRRLKTVLHKPIAEGDDYAESWEVVDRPGEQSVAACGEFTGETLQTILKNQGPALMGRHHGVDRYPLLFKFLDCHANLSVQVHPDNARAAKLDPPDLGKTEAWVVMDAVPGSKIFAGLKNGVDRDDLAEAIQAGRAEDLLHSFEPQIGDCVFIPAGTVHALGAGLVIAEIQQSSNTTYRLYDWNRVDRNGVGRPLHIDAGLEATDYDYGPVNPQPPTPTSEPWRHQLVRCDKFELDRLQVKTRIEIGGDDRAHLLAVLDGQVEVSEDPAESAFAKGQTMLVPAAAGTLTVNPHQPSVLLDIVLP